MADFRILITGSRNWESADRLSFELGLAIGGSGHALGDVVIVHGACPQGADAMADRIALDYGYGREPHPADWEQFGRAAGYRRNADMVALGASVALAFIAPCIAPACRDKPPHGSHGATDCADRAERAGIETRRFWEPRANATSRVI